MAYENHILLSLGMPTFFLVGWLSFREVLRLLRVGFVNLEGEVMPNGSCTDGTSCRLRTSSFSKLVLPTLLFDRM